MSRPFPAEHPGHEVWAPVSVKTPKPHLRVTSATCGDPSCGCQSPEVSR